MAWKILKFNDDHNYFFTNHTCGVIEPEPCFYFPQKDFYFSILFFIVISQVTANKILSTVQSCDVYIAVRYINIWSLFFILFFSFGVCELQETRLSGKNVYDMSAIAGYIDT